MCNRRFPLDDEQPVVGSEDHPKMAAYDARNDRIDLNNSSSSAAFDNPGYCSLAGAHGNSLKQDEEQTNNESAAAEFVNPVYQQIDGVVSNLKESHI